MREIGHDCSLINCSMNTPISYYGGKQRLVNVILPMIPDHTLYAEPFCGGAAIFFAKQPSLVEVINDTNGEVVNFYEVLKTDFERLKARVEVSMHSRQMHSDASVIYNNPHLFGKVDRAWALWVSATQSFSSQVDGSFGYDRIKNTTSKKIANKVLGFTQEYAVRLSRVQIESTDALRIIKTRDFADAFFYCDPPYYNACMGHYGGYSLEDFERLLIALSGIKGKFLLSSYPSDVLTKYTEELGWQHKELYQTVSVNNKAAKPGKLKTEVLTANYLI